VTASRGPFRWAASAQGSQPAEKEHEKAQKNLTRVGFAVKIGTSTERILHRSTGVRAIAGQKASF
jgi:hypothetical protein